MSQSKVIILTGASRGIGLAIAHILLKQSHKLVLVARTEAPLQGLKRQYPGQVEYVAADLTDFSVAGKVTGLALSSFSRIDGLILNHGTLSAVTRISSSSLSDWQSVFNINLFSCVAFVKAALPSLRSSKGRIIFTSSGASTNGYATWGAYGSSKAALNHLALTLATEEKDIITVSVRPGVVDTGMQQSIRDVHANNMDAQDREKFEGLHRDGKLLKPEQPGGVIAQLSLSAGSNLSGKFLSWDDASLAAFQTNATPDFGHRPVHTKSTPAEASPGQKGINIAGDGMGSRKGFAADAQKSKSIRIGGDGMGGRSGAGRSWGFGDESDGEETGGVNAVRRGVHAKVQAPQSQSQGGDFWNY